MQPTNATLSPTEAIVDKVNAFSSECIGCRRTGTEVMVTFMVESDPRNNNGPVFYDMFLSKAQAMELSRRLTVVIDGTR